MIYATVDSSSFMSSGTNEFVADVRSDMESLLSTALIGDSDLPAHIFSDSGARTFRSSALQRLVGRNIHWQHLAMFPKLADENEYILVASSRGLGAACALRAASGTAFPISVLFDPIEPSDLFGLFLNARVRLRECDSIIVRSESAKATVVNLSSALAMHPCPTIEVVRPTIDHDEFHPRDRAFCREVLGLPKDRTLIFAAPTHLSRLEPILRTLQSLLHDHPTLMLVVLVENSKQKAAIEKVVQAMSLGDFCIVVADLPATSVPLMFAAVDIFITLEVEINSSSALQILKAQACGAGVVAASWGANRELVKDGCTGLLVRSYWNPVAATMASWLCAGDGVSAFLSDRTLIDMFELRHNINLLLSQPGCCRRLAEAASEDSRNGSQKAVGERVIELWRKQCSLAAAPTSAIENSVDLTESFAHLASHYLDENVPLIVTAEGRLALGNEMKPGDVTAIPQLIRSEAVAILSDSKRRSATTIGEHLNRQSPFSLEAIVWLLGNGYLHVNHSRENLSDRCLDAKPGLS